MTARPGEEDRRTLALLGSLCFFLSTLEYLIPKPLPFMRIGLANLPLLMALDLFSPPVFALLVLIKVTGQALIGGTLFSYVFLLSLAGTSASAALMYGLRRFLGKERSGFTGISAAGAFVSNAVQLLAARFLVFGAGLRYLVPPFLAAGLIAGSALGFFCEVFTRRSRWYAGRREAVHNRAPLPVAAAGPSAPPGGRGARWDMFFGTGALCAAGLVMTILFLFTSSTGARCLQFLFFWLLAAISGKKNKALTTILVMLGIIIFNLAAPYGRVLAAWGPFKITQGSLLAGLRRAVTLEGLLMLSGAFIRPGLRLPGAFGSIMGESFRFLSLMQERKIRFREKGIIAGIDELLLEPGPPAGADVPEPPQAGRGLNGKFPAVSALCGMILITAALALGIKGLP